MSIAVRLLAEPVRELGFAVLGVAYSPIGTSVNHPIRQFILQNYTDTAVMISFNGVDDHIPLSPNAYIIDDITSNKTTAQGFYLAEGQRLYVKQIGAVATSGSVWFSAFYGADI
jgi:hypothetical protein